MEKDLNITPPIQKYVNNRNHLFDFLKMLCITMIIVTHSAFASTYRNIFVFPFIIDLAVPIFLIISSLLRAKKIEKIGIKGYYSIKNLFHSFIIIIIPYIIVFVIELVLCLILTKYNIIKDEFFEKTFIGIIKWFITGLTGPGSYYVPILIQLLLLFPLVFVLFKRNRYLGLILAFLINLLYELFAYYLPLNDFVYRLLIFRYVLVIGLGIFIANSNMNKKEDLIALVFLLFGLIYLIINTYFWPFPLFKDWKTTSMFAVFFAYGLFYFVYKFFHNIQDKKIFIIGKASYHIYLTQMVFYAFGGNYITKYIFSFSTPFIQEFFAMIISVFICLIVGLCFYLLDSYLRNKIKTRMISTKTN